MRLDFCSVVHARALLLCFPLAVSGCDDQTDPVHDGDEEAASEGEQPEDDEEELEDSGQRKRDASEAAGDAGRGRARDAAPSSPVPQPDAGSGRGRRDGGASTMGDADTRSSDADASGPGVGAGGSVSGIPEDELEVLREACVEEINMYRATLQLPPLARATAAQEACSDQGAQKDGTSKRAHSSAGMGNPCYTGNPRDPFPAFAAQNTCPDWPVGGFGGAQTIADTLKTCLKQMWAEGSPPEGEEQCKAEYFAGDSTCFLAHGHYLNMKDTASKAVSCGFYKTGGNTYWMNQDFSSMTPR